MEERKRRKHWHGAISDLEIMEKTKAWGYQYIGGSALGWNLSSAVVRIFGDSLLTGNFLYRRINGHVTVYENVLKDGHNLVLVAFPSSEVQFENIFR